jgi:phosphoribosylanthranilate isomerase
MAFIKVCGLMDASTVDAALAAGVDAIGFVFAPSVRQIEPAQAAVLAAAARGRALRVAVTQHPDADVLSRIFEEFQPDVLQTDAEDLAAIKLPAGVTAWPVLRGASVPQLALTRDQTLLFEGPRSGTGQLADWSRARTLAENHRLILAGGLAPTNVAAAIAQVRPFGVDVSSGVEDAPGRKSPALIQSFVTAARAAFARSADP